MEKISSDEIRQIEEETQYRKNLRTKFLNKGLDNFLEKEMLDLLLSYSISRGEISKVSEALLRKFGCLRNIIEAPVDELVACPKMDVNSAVLLKIAKNFSENYLKHKIVKENLGNCRQEILNYCFSNMAHLKDEQFRVIFMNCQNEVIEIEAIHEGTIDQAAVYPRKVMERALHYKAAAMILIHNHPSGKAKPSVADRDVTESLNLAASSMDVKILDHIIIAKDSYYSFFESGLLNPFNTRNNLLSTFNSKSRMFWTLKEVKEIA